MPNQVKIALAVILLIAIIVSIIAVFSIEKTKYNIDFDSNGGSDCYSIKTSGKHALVLPEPERDGYIFEGWFFDKDEWKKELTATTYLKSRLTENVTVYAKWKFYGYKIRFETNGGSFVEDKLLDKNEAIDQPPFTEREGYSFMWWCIDKSLLKPYEIGTPINKSITLYAKWLADENKQHCTIIFETNGGEEIPSAQVLEGDTYILSTPTRIGYNFVGWFDVDYEIKYHSDIVVTTDIILYAKWQRDENMLMISFNSNGGTEVATIFVEVNDKISPPICTRVGYEFTKWYTDEELSQEFAFDMPITQDILLYAGWQKEEEVTEVFYVYYYDNDELLHKRDIMSGNTVEDIRHEKEGWDLVGWYIDDTLQIPFDFTQPIYEDVFLYAKWEEIIPDIMDDEGFIYRLNSVGDAYIIIGYEGENKDIIIPEQFDNQEIISIDNQAFYEKEIETIEFSNTIKNIGIEAFANSQLTEIYIPSSIESILQGAFRNCKSLQKIEFEAMPETMGRYLFENCAVTEISLAGSILALPEAMFLKCKSLESISLLLECQKIGADTFKGCQNLVDVKIGNSFKIIGRRAFEGCISLTSIDLKNIEKIESGAFASSGLESIVLSNNVEELGGYVFENCHKLEEVYIGSALKTITSPEFFSASKLKKFEVAESNQYYKAIDNNLYSKDGTIFIRYAPGQAEINFSIPEGVKSIEDYAFSYAQNLQRIILNKNIMNIGNYVFWQMKEIKEFEVHEENERFSSDDGVIYNKDFTQLKHYPQYKETEEFSINENTKEIMTEAFIGLRNTRTIILPTSLERIHSASFYQAESIETIEGLEYSQVTDIGDSAFYQCKNLQDIELPQTIESIGDNAFEGTAIKQLVIVSNVTYLGKEAFANCKQLEKISIGSGINKLEERVFDNCDNLEAIRIFNNNIIEITANAFSQDIKPTLYLGSDLDQEDKLALRNGYRERYGHIFEEIENLIV